MARTITIKTIPHKEQDYDTVGNWKITPHEMLIFVSDMDNDDSEFVIGIHEAIEAWLCEKNGISQDDVDNWDMWYEEAREQGTAACGCPIYPTSEPGNDKHCPYRKEHQFTTKIEKMLVKRGGMDWTQHDILVNSLM